MTEPNISNHLNDFAKSYEKDIITSGEAILAMCDRFFGNGEFNTLAKGLLKSINAKENILLGFPKEGIIITSDKFHIIKGGVFTPSIWSYQLNQINKLIVKSGGFRHGEIKVGNENIKIL